jgi:hypothetical protein
MSDIKKNVEIDYEPYGTIAIDYYVNCFDRMVTILFSGIDKEDTEKIEEQLEENYFKWHEVDDYYMYGCEEYMIEHLHPYYKNHIVAVIYDNDEEEDE